ncbi:MAG: DNA repair protein RadA [Lachnospiraceae bacterium]|nr:DNA repair protein RadA [Lachnospiraceae bacterium]MDD5854251.1 DNA repair protein RadA [Lachnospiraceae bacterium]
MAKGKAVSAFFCQNCGYESSKWMGQCPACHEWNSFVEEPVIKSSHATGQSVRRVDRPPVSIDEIKGDKEERFTTDIEEFDRVLGGGIVPGSLTLVGGDPGIGKSTLLLQVCKQLSDAGREVLYISGEESLSQIKMRADRIGTFQKQFRLLTEINLDIIAQTVKKEKPDVVVIDSIQTMFNEQVNAAPGSVSQVRESTAVLLQLAKGENIAILIVGHVTKEGTVAGPRVLEHMVDTVLYFEGDKQDIYRILRGVKNRFGSTNEIGVFEMEEGGLREIKNPSEYMISGKPQGASGSVVTCCMEGTRPMLMEVQALVCDTNFQIPRRQATGCDFNRMNLLIAVIEKRIRIPLGHEDAYINFAGGMKITEPATDLAVVMALVSSYKNTPIDDKMIVFGEVGLSGEVRGVSMVKQRVLEAKKMGYTSCMVPYTNYKQLADIKDMKIYPVKNIKEAVSLMVS